MGTRANAAEFVETGHWLHTQYYPRSADADWFATVTLNVGRVRYGLMLRENW